jgi:cation diffusion facilitator family transporter
MQPAQKNIQVQRLVAILSVVLLIVKITAYYLTQSVGILTDALESIVNVVAGFLGLYSLRLAAKPSDEDHPYGHGKIEFVSAAVEGSMISIAGLLIIYEAIRNLINPLPIQKLDIGLILIAVTAAANYIMGSICLRIGRKNNSIALQASGKHLQSDTYTTMGIVAGLVVVLFTNIQWLDSVVAIIFAIIILRTGYNIIRTSLAGILDETDQALLIKLVTLLDNNKKDNWMDLHNLRIIKYGNVLHIDCHLTVPWYFNLHEAHAEIDDFTKLVRDRFGDSIEFFIHTDGCLEFQCRICSKKDCPVRQHTQEKRIKWTVENISNNHKHNVLTQEKDVVV